MMAVVHRYHPEYELPSLMSRTMMLQLARLMPSLSDDEKHMNRLYTRLEKLLRKDPAKFLRGRHMFVQELFNHLRDRAWTHSTRAIPHDMTLRIFKSHIRAWRNQSDASQRMFEQLALLRATEVEQEIQSELDGVRAARDLLLQRMSGDADESAPMIFSESTFTQDELDQIGAIVANPASSIQQDMEGLRRRSREVPKPQPERFDALKLHHVWNEGNLEMPAWASAIIRKRDFFANCMLMIVRQHGKSELYKFVYAVQQPHILALSALELSDDFGFDMSGGHVFGIGPGMHYEAHCNIADNILASDVDPANIEDVFVIPNAMHTREMIIASPCMAEPLAQYLAALPDNEPAEQVAKKAKKRDERGHEELVQQLPWLQELDQSVGFASTSSKEKDKGDTDGHDDKKEGRIREELDVDEQEAVMRALDAARDRLARAPDPFRVVDFRWRLLGGAWTQENEGRAFSACQGYASGAAAIAWTKARWGPADDAFRCRLVWERVQCCPSGEGFLPQDAVLPRPGCCRSDIARRSFP